ncbi:MAG: hypothetical protein ACLR8Y_14215 [Alistipes indistinctus]
MIKGVPGSGNGHVHVEIRQKPDACFSEAGCPDDSSWVGVRLSALIADKLYKQAHALPIRA